MTKYPIVAFSSGELTPLADARSDVDKYRAGCRTLENMLPLIYGAAVRRPGTKYIDTCNGVARVMPFVYSNTIAYILLLENQRMWFYYDGGRVLDDSSRRLGIDTPYLAADLFEIQYKQSNDVMWLTHGDYAPRKLSRTSATAFALTEITFDDGPFLTRNDIANDDGVTMTPSVTTVGATGTLTASADTFTAGHVGALFKVYQPRVNVEVAGSMTAPTTGVIGTSLAVEGPFTFRARGTWTGKVVLERSIDNATWETYRAWRGDADTKIQFTDTESEAGVYYRINVAELTANTVKGFTGTPSKVIVDLTVNSSVQTGVCRITGYTSPTVASMTVLKAFASTNADVRWSEGAWSAYRGYPRCVTFYGERCVYAATDHQPQTIWFSAVDDYDSFNEGTNDDDAFSITLSSDTRSAIQWLSPLEVLIVGTADSEWRVRSDAYDSPMTPTNFSAKQQTTYGSKALQALTVNDAILFSDFVGRKVREVGYDAGRDKYLAPDLTALAEHVTLGGITSMAFQKNPDPILWCFLATGTLLSMTYDKENTVIAWARHPMISADVEKSGTTPTLQYPTLQELTDDEIPDAPTPPAEIPLASAISITDAAGLAAITNGNHYSINADIDMTGVVWTPLSISGAGDLIIEGNGHTISNLSVTGTSTYRGFFGVLGDGNGGTCEIRNLTFSNCSSGQSGGATGYATSIFIAGASNWTEAMVLRNITISDSNITKCEFIAGLFIGEMLAIDGVWVVDCDVVNCTIADTLFNSKEDIGGFVGIVADVNPNTGIANSTGARFINCTVQGGTLATSSTPAGGQTDGIGGFAGDIRGTSSLYNCWTSMDISCNVTGLCRHIGGFAGETGRVSSGASYDPFPVVYVSCYATGDVTITTTATLVAPTEYTPSYIGGFIGGTNFSDTGDLTATNCYCTGSITLGNTSATETNPASIGGFIGNIGHYTMGYMGAHAFLRCYSTSAVTLDCDVQDAAYIGGFVGEIGVIDNTCTIDRCWATGDVTITGTCTSSGNTRIGGFIGEVESLAGDYGTEVTNCYTWSSIVANAIVGTSYLGGFVGTHDNPSNVASPGSGLNVFTNCYCAQTDSATGNGYVNQIPDRDNSNGFGSALGDTAGMVVSASYYDTQTGLSSSIYATGQVTTWMQTKSNYEAAGWDFDTIWYIPPGTPWEYDFGSNSVAVIPSSTEDEVWLVVSRVINGSLVRYLEQMQPRAVTDLEDEWFVDSGLALETADADGIVTGLDHLEGEEVVVFADGGVRARQTVSGGSVNTGAAITSKCIVGLPFTYVLKPMRFDLTLGGTTKGTLKRFAELVISFYKSGGVKYGEDANNLFTIDFRTTEAYGSPPALYTGDRVVTCEGGWNVEDSLIISGDEPLPCVIRCLVPRIEVGGR